MSHGGIGATRTTATPPSPTLPKVRRTYQSGLLDSTRWGRYTPRKDDVIVTTPYKSGTTWTLNIVRRLIFLGQEVPPFKELWIDSRFQWPLDELMAELAAQTHRRYIKTHLALDGLPYYPQVKYIMVGRDARDVFMSFWNHYRNFTPGAYDFINTLPDRVGPPLPVCPEDIHEVWRDWIGRGWFDWESEGYPFWGNLHHVQSWWNYRHLDNILFVHYNDLKADLSKQVKSIAAFLDIEVPEAALPGLLENLSLEAMRNEAARNQPGMSRIWTEGARTFFFKGTNGRWREVLTPEEMALYDKKAAEALTPECRVWLEGGQAALT
jgi:aryl sulfotransferase